VGDAHSLRVPHRERLVDGIANQAVKNRFELLFQQISEGCFCLDAARIDVAVWFNAYLGAVVLVLQKVERA